MVFEIPRVTPKVAEASRLNLNAPVRKPIPQSNIPSPFESVGALLDKTATFVANELDSVQKTRDVTQSAKLLTEYREAGELHLDTLLPDDIGGWVQSITDKTKDLHEEKLAEAKSVLSREAFAKFEGDLLKQGTNLRVRGLAKTREAQAREATAFIETAKETYLKDGGDFGPESPERDDAKDRFNKDMTQMVILKFRGPAEIQTIKDDAEVAVENKYAEFKVKEDPGFLSHLDEAVLDSLFKKSPDKELWVAKDTEAFLKGRAKSSATLKASAVAIRQSIGASDINNLSKLQKRINTDLFALTKDRLRYMNRYGQSENDLVPRQISAAIKAGDLVLVTIGDLAIARRAGSAVKVDEAMAEFDDAIAEAGDSIERGQIASFRRALNDKGNRIKAEIKANSNEGKRLAKAANTETRTIYRGMAQSLFEQADTLIKQSAHTKGPDNLDNVIAIRDEALDVLAELKEISKNEATGTTHAQDALLIEKLTVKFEAMDEILKGITDIKKGVVFRGPQPLTGSEDAGRQVVSTVMQKNPSAISYAGSLSATMNSLAKETKKKITQDSLAQRAFDGEFANVVNPEADKAMVKAFWDRPNHRDTTSSNTNYYVTRLFTEDGSFGEGANLAITMLTKTGFVPTIFVTTAVGDALAEGDTPQASIARGRAVSFLAALSRIDSKITDSVQSSIVKAAMAQVSVDSMGLNVDSVGKMIARLQTEKARGLDIEVAIAKFREIFTPEKAKAMINDQLNNDVAEFFGLDTDFFADSDEETIDTKISGLKDRIVNTYLTIMENMALTSEAHMLSNEDGVNSLMKDAYKQLTDLYSLDDLTGEELFTRLSPRHPKFAGVFKNSKIELVNLVEQTIDIVLASTVSPAVNEAGIPFDPNAKDRPVVTGAFREMLEKLEFDEPLFGDKELPPGVRMEVTNNVIGGQPTWRIIVNGFTLPMPGIEPERGIHLEIQPDRVTPDVKAINISKDLRRILGVEVFKAMAVFERVFSEGQRSFAEQRRISITRGLDLGVGDGAGPALPRDPVWNLTGDEPEFRGGDTELGKGFRKTFSLPEKND